MHGSNKKNVCCRRLAFLFLLLLLAGQLYAQLSTSGPTPPPGIDMGLYPPSRDQVTISGVPAYEWHHGCGPTALGMVIGYWDGHGCRHLVPGDASGMTGDVLAMIANDSGNPECDDMTADHYRDYSCPRDDNEPAPIPDKSELGGAHESNCLADFMHTSWSAYYLLYGWSYDSDVPLAAIDYVDYIAPQYDITASNTYFDYFSWADYKAEIDAGRPMVLLVDTDGNGSTDHFVAAIGYDDVNNRYGVYNTWDEAIHWYEWRGMAPGIGWGVLTITLIDISHTPRKILVPDEALTIQEAIDVADDGDTIAVAPGYYTGDGFRDIVVSGRPVILAEGGRAETILDCQGSPGDPHRGFEIGVGPDAVIEVAGFTIVNGYSEKGGGIYCFNTPALIRDCIIRDCQAYRGGAVYCDLYAEATFENCDIFDNSAEYGGGMYCFYSSPTIQSTMFYNNSAVNGGAYYCEGSQGVFTNCSFSNNAATYGSGLFYSGSYYPSLENSIIAFGIDGEALFCLSGSISFDVTCCDIFGNDGGDWTGCLSGHAAIDGNFSADPMFCSGAGGDLDLLENSPCVPENNECSILVGAGEVGCAYMCGDLNDDGDINILDIVYLINFKYKSGPAPDPMNSADVNSDGNINILDIVYLINYKYKDGPDPDCP